MPQPRPATVVLLLAVFACVALYVLGVGLGAQDRSSGGRSPLSKEERQSLRERLFGKPSPVEPDALEARGCLLSGEVVRVSPARECQVEVAKSGTRLRTLAVEPLTGSRVDARLEPGGKPAVAASFEDLGKREELDVPREGAALSLRCTRPVGTPPECLVRLR